jgi:hypothetical protein
LINAVWKEELPEQWRSKSLFLFTRRVIQGYKAISLLLSTYKVCGLG